MNPIDFTPIQRAIKLYMALDDGEIIVLEDWAKRMGKTRQAIYHQLQLMSEMGIPVVQLDNGKWVLSHYAERYGSWSGE